MRILTMCCLSAKYNFPHLALARFHVAFTFVFTPSLLSSFLLFHIFSNHQLLFCGRLFR